MADQDQREREWNEQGEYAEMYSTEEVYDILASLPKQVGIASDISDALDCSTLTARNKLQELRFERQVEKRDTGGRTVLWYIPDENSEESADIDTDADEIGDADMTLKRLSTELGEAITVGDIVYEDGDKHPVDAES